MPVRRLPIWGQAISRFDDPPGTSLDPAAFGPPFRALVASPPGLVVDTAGMHSRIARNGRTTL